MPKIDIETDYIEKLAELLARTGLTELEISQGDARVRVARHASPVEHIHLAAAAAPRVPAPAGNGSATANAELDEAPHPGTITSPMVGTAYLHPEPGAPAFIKVGDEVKEGQTLLIVEAMKVMNSIRSPRPGRVARIFAHNAAPVEYGEPLLVLE